MATRFPTLTRRDFLRVGGVGVAGYSLLPMLQATNLQSPAAVTPRGGAEICIFIMLQGAPSQMDTFDAKLNRETPEDFDIRTIRDGVRMPVGTLPLLTERLDKYAIIRSMEFWEKDHNRGTYYIQAGRPETPSRMKEVPSFGAVLAYESLNQRRDTDFLPPYISLNVRTDLLVANGLLPPSCSPMSLNARVKPPFVMPDSERETFKVRRELLKQLDREWREMDTGRGTIFSDMDNFYHSAGLLSNPEAADVFKIEDEDKKRYGEIDYVFNHLGNACVMARNIAEADAGTKFIIINHGTWDLHSDIYDKSKTLNQYRLNNEIDLCLANLLDDLESRTDKQGRRLIDKTLVVCMGEFGRTPGALNDNMGRDHHDKAGIAVFAGAGVKGGRVIGATDETAAKVIDPGWHMKRSIYPEDVIATIFSAMGVDWSKKLVDTPSGRHFEYVESLSPKGPMDFREISELFA